MRKTGAEIEADIYAIIKASSIKTTIAGTIYKDGMRPMDAKTEDAVVSFLTGTDGEIQKGVVNLNIYVPDIDNGGGQLVKNTARCKTLEVLVNGIIQALKPAEYRLQLDSIIQTFPTEGLKQHFVNTRIKFELATF